MKHCLEELVKKYPQLLMPIKKDIKNSEEYKDVVLRGKETSYKLSFSFDEDDKLENINTPIGSIDVLSLRKREDFIHAVRSLGYKCEPVDVPDSTGAIYISGLNNWDKVKAGLDDYKDSIILISSGNYSNVSAFDIKQVSDNEILLTDKEWIDKSIEIRKYHELTHFLMRKQYPEDIKAIRDEIIADGVGLVGTFGYFDDRLIKLFFGIEKDEYREGGRLQNYEGGNKENIPHVLEMIDKYKILFSKYNSVDDIWENIKEFI